MSEEPQSGTPPKRLLSDEAVRKVLSRAAELDSIRGSQITVADLTNVAQEAGISVNSLQQALAELDQAPDLLTHSSTGSTTSRAVPDSRAKTKQLRNRFWRLVATALSGPVLVALVVDDIEHFGGSQYFGDIILLLVAIVISSITAALVLTHRRSMHSIGPNPRSEA